MTDYKVTGSLRSNIIYKHILTEYEISLAEHQEMLRHLQSLDIDYSSMYFDVHHYIKFIA